MPGLTIREIEAIVDIEQQIEGGNHNLLPNAFDHHPEYRTLIRRWMVLHGVSTAKANIAGDKSLANCYRVGEPYLRTMRENKRDRSTVELEDIGLDSLLDNPPLKPEAQTPSANITIAADQIAQAAEKVIGSRLATLKSDLRKEIASDIASCVTDSMKNTKRELDDWIYSQVKDQLAKLAPPRQIEIINTDGTSVNVGRQHDKFPILLKLIGARGHNGHRLNLWLTGPTGSGKTTAVENVAKALSSTFTSYHYSADGTSWVTDSNGQKADIGLKFDGPFGGDSSLDADYKVTGYDKADGTFRWTTFLRIFCFGGVYIADEIDNWMPSALVAMNAPLANGWVSTPLGMMRRHKDCCIVAAANTWGMGATDDYVGRSKLDAATVNRFPTKIDWPIDEKLERAIAYDMGRSDWCDIVQSARAAAKSQGLKVIFSPRNTFEGIATLNAGFTLREVVDMNLTSGLKPEQVKALGLDKIQDLSNDKLTTFRNYVEMGMKIEAIKLWRQDREWQIGLRDAKDYVEDIIAGYKPTPISWEVAQ